ncbi:MAG: PEP-CTERM sorting domain-containing protein [Rhodocyclales bacterium GT-UBC]|nr:MAG: PEP-CTERM sorting domain-containing protein [Rhodocyclales bacterium GT-UBC]
MKIRALATTVALLFAGAAQADVITLTFEGVGNQASVNNFYNGGTDSLGNSGTNYGIQFGTNSLGLIDADANGGNGGNFANEPSPSTILFFLSGTAILNYMPGFTTGFSFYYTSSTAASVNVYDGLDATGNLLGSIDLTANFNNNCTGDPTGRFCHWDIGSLAFTGVAKSIDFGGTVDNTGYDNITFGSTNPSGVPEPTTIALLGLGLVGAAVTRRRRSNI